MRCLIVLSALVAYVYCEQIPQKGEVATGIVSKIKSAILTRRVRSSWGVGYGKVRYGDGYGTYKSRSFGTSGDGNTGVNVGERTGIESASPGIGLKIKSASRRFNGMKSYQSGSISGNGLFHGNSASGFHGSSGSLHSGTHLNTMLNGGVSGGSVNRPSGGSTNQFSAGFQNHQVGVSGGLTNQLFSGSQHHQVGGMNSLGVFQTFSKKSQLGNIFLARNKKLSA